MTVHELETVEDGVLEALASLSSQGVKTLEVYNGHLDSPEALDRLIRRFPCVIVATGSLDSEPENRVDLARVEVHLLVGDRHRRGPVGAARGDSQSPGVLTIMANARRLLNSSIIGSGWSRFRWLGDEMIIEDSKTGVSLWRSSYETRKPLER